MGTISFKPVVADHKKADGTYTIRIRVTANRKSKYISTNISVSDSQLTRTGNIKDRAVLDNLDALVARMRAASADIDPFVVSRMTVDEIARYIENNQEGTFRLEFFGFAQKVIESKATKNTRNYYRNAVVAFAEFTGRKSMDISEITSSLMRNFEAWLVAKYGKGARATGAYPESIGHIHGQARLMYNNEETGEIKIRNPFAYFHATRTRQPAHRNVSRETIQAFIDRRDKLTLKTDIMSADLFLLSFALMGMNAADLYACPAPQDGILIYNRAKTASRRDDNAEMHVMIDPRIQKLFEKWADPEKKHALRLYKKICPNVLNLELSIGLRRACKLMGIEERLTFYSARHTWATLAYSAGVDKSIINDCLCHVDESMRVTDIYIAKDWERLWKANEKVLDLFDWTKCQ